MPIPDINDLLAPRVTPQDLEDEIAMSYYFTADQGLCETPAPDVLKRLTFCVIVLKNGFTVTGESACVSSANFNAEIGKKIAREHAIEKLWPLLGFRLADKLASS